MSPRCCGQNAEFIVQSISLKYWFCRECRNEVDPDGVKGQPVSGSAALAALNERLATPPPSPHGIGGNGIIHVYGAGGSQPLKQLYPSKALPNTGMLKTGDTLEWRHNDGTFEVVRIQADHVKTIPSTVIQAWVNGRLIYDTTAPIPVGVPTPAACKHTTWVPHALPAGGIGAHCGKCGIDMDDYQQQLTKGIP